MFAMCFPLLKGFVETNPNPKLLNRKGGFLLKLEGMLKKVQSILWTTPNPFNNTNYLNFKTVSNRQCGNFLESTTKVLTILHDQ